MNLDLDKLYHKNQLYKKFTRLPIPALNTVEQPAKSVHEGHLSVAVVSQFTSSTGHLTKCFTLEGDQVITTKPAQLSQGKACMIECSLPELAEQIDRMRSSERENQKNKALCIGSFDADGFGRNVSITRQGEENEADNKISRTKAYFKFKKGIPGFMLLDCDPVPGMELSPDEIFEAIGTVIPEAEKAGRVVTTSVSSMVYKEGSNEPVKKGGIHIYVTVQDASLIPEALKIMHERLMLNGYVHYKISSSGDVRQLSLIDSTVGSAERLIYESAPIVSEGLQLKITPAIYTPGPELSIESLVPLTATERKQLDSAKAKWEAEHQAEIKAKKSEWDERRMAVEIAKGSSEDDARKKVALMKIGGKNALELDHELHFHRHGAMTFCEAIERGEELDEESLADPLEDPSEGTQKAKFYWNNGKPPTIHSCAHGASTTFMREEDMRKNVEGGNLEYRFVHVNKSGKPLETIENLKEICRVHGVVIRYNEMSKEIEILIPGGSYTQDNMLNVTVARLRSLCHEANMSTRHLHSFIVAIGDENLYNPVRSWILSREWDGISRLQDFYDTVVEDPAGISKSVKEMYMRRWVLSAIAAAFSPNGVMARGVITFQGAQYIGKTRWVASLAPKDLALIKTGRSIQPNNKDSVKQAISAWITEAGELDGTFKRSDNATLKMFFSSDSDEFRKPYAERESRYPRRTVFAASVNDEAFLHDTTGNTRYWTIPVTTMHHDHEINMQQFWAEVLKLWKSGEQHYLTKEENDLLCETNEQFEVVDPIVELISSELDWDNFSADNCKWVTPSDVLRMLSIANPNRWDAITAGKAIRKLNGDKGKKINGTRLVAVPKERLYNRFKNGGAQTASMEQDFAAREISKVNKILEESILG